VGFGDSGFRTADVLGAAVAVGIVFGVVNGAEAADTVLVGAGDNDDVLTPPAPLTPFVEAN